MQTILREIQTYRSSGEIMWLVECDIDTDTTWMGSESQTRHRDHYFRQREFGMRAKKATQISPGVFELEGGEIVTEQKPE